MGLEDKADDVLNEEDSDISMVDDFVVDDDGNSISAFQSGDISLGECVTRRDRETIPVAGEGGGGGTSGFRMVAEVSSDSITPVDFGEVEQIEETFSRVRESSRKQIERLLSFVREVSGSTDNEEFDDSSVSQSVGSNGVDWRRSTLPDIGIINWWGETQERPFLEEIDREVELQRYFRLLADEVGMEEEVKADDHLEREVELAEIRRGVSTLPPAAKAERIIEKLYRYRVPWWESSNSLVRLWGQLDASLQKLTDEQFVKDVIDVLGNHPLFENETMENQDAIRRFANLIKLNVPYIKKIILRQYSGNEALFAAIIEKQTKEE